MNRPPSSLRRLRGVTANWKPLLVEIALIAFVIAAIFAAALVGMSAARAADAAERAILGFNSSGTVFAYEQYGRQDGSGFPYADIFYVQTGTKDWAFYPVRVLVRSERRSVRHARALARSRASGPRAVSHYTYPGRLAASDAITESPRAGDAIAFETGYISGGEAPKYAVNLYKSTEPTARCADLTGGEEKKLTITLRNVATGTEAKLQDDRIIPKSRGCPLDYSISDVVLYDKPGGTAVAVVIVNVLRHGFEGRDRRFMAVSGTLQ